MAAKTRKTGPVKQEVEKKATLEDRIAELESEVENLKTDNQSLQEALRDVIWRYENGIK